RRRRAGIVIRLLSATLLAVATVAAGAVAASATTVAPVPSSLRTGFVDYEDVQTLNNSTRVRMLTKMKAAGASVVRVGLPWSIIAPAAKPKVFDPKNPDDPHYNWQTF